MKNLVICVGLLTAISFSANAGLECKGQGKDNRVTMSVLDIANRKVVEGQKNPVAIRIVEVIKNTKGYTDERILFAGVVNGVIEDVGFFLESMDKKSLKGTIFLDELNDMSISVGRREIRFSCKE